MKITKFIHSFIQVEENGSTILFDPGSYSFIEGKLKPDRFQNIDAIFITHAHKDHYDVEVIKTILQNNPNCKIYTNSDMVKVLSEEGLSSELFEEGDQDIAGFKIKAFFAAHERVLNRELPKNTAFIVNGRFLHPGDSYAKEVFDYKPEVLALPVAGSWMNINEGFEFSQKSHAKIVLPIHDGHIKDFFSSSMYKFWEGVWAEQKVRFVQLLEAGDSIEI